MTPEYLKEEAAAAVLQIAPKTLSRWRWAGKGPRYYKFGGAVRYAKSDLDAFAAISVSGSEVAR